MKSLRQGLIAPGWLANNHPGYPGYSGEIPLAAATLPETLRAAGYATIMCGKWHNTPAAENVSGGSRHNWPTQRGFDSFYGFMDGETHHFFPSRLMRDNQLIPIDSYPPEYYSGDDWVDQGIRFVQELRESRPEKPFFLYIANNAMHAPLQTKAVDMAAVSVAGFMLSFSGKKVQGASAAPGPDARTGLAVLAHDADCQHVHNGGAMRLQMQCLSSSRSTKSRAKPPI